MTPQHIALLRRSFSLIEPIAPQAAAIFYDNLFTADPSLRRLFHGNLAQQSSRLMTMIATAIRLLDHPDGLQPVLGKLGARHAAYGVRDEHYDVVGTVLLKTLGQCLGTAYTADVNEAWMGLYALVSRTMQEGAREAMANAA